MKKFTLLSLLVLAGLFTATAQNNVADYWFTATTGSYANLTVPTGATRINAMEADNHFQANVPIGFTFMYCGIPYTQVFASSNGWLSFVNCAGDFPGNTAAADIGNIGPSLHPLWDDLSGVNGICLYQTEGFMPNRIFTFEWRQWRWDPTSLDNVIKFQVKLYETTNVIEFMYGQLANPVVNGSASIGIARNATDYMMLNVPTASPAPSTTTFTNNIGAKPPTDQIYRFSPPPPCDNPVLNIKKSGITVNSIGQIKWDPVPNAKQYEYVLNKTAADPTGGPGYQYVYDTDTNATSLESGVCYYIHVRAVCHVPNDVGPWSVDSFCTILDCYTPEAIIENVTHTSAVARWNPVPNAYGYEYAVGTSETVPPSFGMQTNYTNVILQGLAPNKPLYFYLRAKCTPIPLSPWRIVPFHTFATTSVATIEGEGVLLVYPNPANDKVSVDLKGMQYQNAVITISDVMGRQIAVVRPVADVTDINIANQPAGLYILKYESPSGQQNVRITKQ